MSVWGHSQHSRYSFVVEDMVHFVALFFTHFVEFLRFRARIANAALLRYF
jgi:hypothetical protein